MSGAGSALHEKTRLPVRGRVANERLMLVLVVSAVVWLATNAVTMSSASEAPRGATTTAGWTPDVGLAVVLNARLEILRSGKATVVSSSRGITELSWSSDGRWLAFERPYRSTSSVWVVHVDGSELREVASGAIVSYRWSTTGDVLALATSNATPPFSSTVRVIVPPSTSRVVDRIGDGEVGPIVASGSQLAFGDTVFKAGVGFTHGSLLLESVSGAKARVVVGSNKSSYQPLGFSPDGKTLLYAIDPQNSASIAADGLQIHARSSAADRALGVALVDPGSWSWSSGSADLAITLGASRGPGRLTSTCGSVMCSSAAAVRCGRLLARSLLVPPTAQLVDSLT